MKLPSPTEKRILNCVTFAGITGNDLKSALKKTYKWVPCNGSFYTMLRRLTNNGWVEIRKSDKDIRMNTYHLTKQSARMVNVLDALDEVHANKKELKV